MDISILYLQQQHGLPHLLPNLRDPTTRKEIYDSYIPAKIRNLKIFISRRTITHTGS